MTCRQDWLTNQREPLKEIVDADSTKIPVQSCGEGKTVTTVHQKQVEIEIKSAQYVPNLTTNLLSISEILKNGNSVEFNEDGCKIYYAEKVLLAMASLVKGVYKLKATGKYLFSGKTVVTGETWHKRLGHINSGEKMKDDLVNDITVVHFKFTRKIVKYAVRGSNHDNLLNILEPELQVC